MSVDATVVTHAPTTTIVKVTAPPTVSVAVVETEQVVIEHPGTVGQQGPIGPTGADAYTDAVSQGFVGTIAQWLASLVGPAQIFVGSTPPDPTVYPLWLDTSASD